MWCTNECWNCEDKTCEHYINKQDIYFKYKQLQSKWNSLKEWLEERIEYWENEEKKWVEQGFIKFGGEANNKIILKGLLDKMNELKEQK